jgi:uncharacterized membrane protein (Fun14 family)
MKHYVMSWWHILQEKLAAYPPWVGEVALFGGSGLIIGFFAKSIGRFILYSFIGAIIALWCLDYLEVVTVHTQVIKNFLGIGTANTIDDVLRLLILWIREHVIGAIAFIIGFLLGWRIG